MTWRELIEWLRARRTPKPAPNPDPVPPPNPDPVPPTEPPAPEPPATAFKTKSFWIHWNSVVKRGSAEAAAIFDREAPRRSHVLLNTWDAWMIPELKKRNPDIKVLVYKDSSSTRSYDSNPVDLQPCGVRYADAPDSWFAKDSSGRRIEYNGYPGHWMMNVENVEYQKAWATNVLNSVRKHGFDGVHIDNLLWTRTAYGAAPANYPNDTALRAAYRAFQVTVRAQLAPAGRLMSANISNARLHSGGWQYYMENLDIGFDEWWLIFNDNDLLSEYEAGWGRVVDEIAWSEANNKIALIQPHFTAGSERPFLYAWASYLMVTNGKSAISELQQFDGYGLPTPWHAEYDWDLGKPLGNKISKALNVWVREFERATVVVNSNRTGSANVTVDTAVGKITLPGTSGRVIRK